jgi:GH24 family phage-related lysozyme (muramidase)
MFVGTSQRHHTSCSSYFCSDQLGEKYVKLYVTVQLTQNQFDALVSFTFNIGGGGALKSSSLLKKINAGETSAAVIEAKFGLWNKGTVKGKLVELKGLTIRREQEANIYNYDKYDSTH